MNENDQANRKKQGPQRDSLGRLLPGHTANPHGAPKRTHEIRDAVIKSLMATRLDGGNDLADVIETLVKKAKRGDVDAARFLVEQVIGKAKAGIELAGPNGGPVVLGPATMTTAARRARAAALVAKAMGVTSAEPTTGDLDDGERNG